MPGSVRIIPLGGLGEVGKNMTAFEADGEVVVVDAGLAFPRDEHLGVDLILPDFSYLTDRERPVRAVILTHGHEDHVGALPYLLRQARVQEVWATRLTLGLIKSKLDEHGLMRAAELKEADPEGGPVQLGPFTVEFVRVAHSIPDSVAVLIDSPGGRILHTGDYKIDHTPVDGLRTDVGRLADLGNRGVDLLLGDSTNAERPGVTGSERLVGEAFRQIIPRLEGRVLMASFASNVHRMQQAIDVAVDVGRKVCVVGRSMRKNVNIARNLGYMEVPEDVLIRPNELEEYAPGEVLILCTGSQGEPLSALVRIAYGDPRIVDRIAAGVTFVDGLGVGDVQDVALRDRRHLSEDGVLIVVATLTGSNGAVAGQPELIARGLAEPDAELLDEMREEAQRVLAELLEDNVSEIKLLQEHLHDGLGQLIYDRTGRRPMILPVVVEV